MLVNRYLKDSEIQEIALEISEAAADGRNNAVSTIIRTSLGFFFAPAQEAAAELYGVALSKSQTIYIAKLAQIGYRGAINKHHRDYPMDNPRSGSFLGKGGV
tara:strand:+ start:437 stop:742 length:306 start_codon:yes stop_codon:yes gene_type:complete